eukprot:368769_1
MESTFISGDKATISFPIYVGIVIIKISPTNTIPTTSPISTISTISSMPALPPNIPTISIYVRSNSYTTGGTIQMDRILNHKVGYKLTINIEHLVLFVYF